MPKPPITRYAVDTLVDARKHVHRVKRNTLESRDPKHGELLILFEIRRVDSPTVDLVLEFKGRVKKAGLPGVASILHPSASLIWRGKRVRCLDHKIVHDVKVNGIVCGRIKGWHEHFWTEADGDDAVRAPDPPVKNFDLHAIITWCSKKWNIEGIEENRGLFDE